MVELSSALFLRLLKGRFNGKQGKIFVETRIHSDLGRLCHRTGKCLQIPDNDRRIRRRVFCADLHRVSCSARHTDHDGGARSRPRKPAQHRLVIRRARKEGAEVASRQVSRHRRKLFAHDVLHDYLRLDADILYKVCGRLDPRVQERGRTRRGIRHGDKQSRAHGLRHIRSHSCLLQHLLVRSAKGRREDNKMDDGGSPASHGGARNLFLHALERRRGTEILSCPLAKII